MARTTSAQSHSEVLRRLALALARKPASEKKRVLTLLRELIEAEHPSEMLEPILALVSEAEWTEAERELDRCAEEGVSLISIFDSGYPSAFREIIDSPVVFYLRGTLPSDKGLAIVGSRKSTQYGNTFAYALAKKLSSHRIPVISGLARGIDSAAHQGAVEEKAVTIAILGSGVLNIYPAENETLAERVLENGGAILSEYGLHTSPRDYFFPERNRLVAAISKAVVVVEAEKRSGALITARLAAEQGRDVFAVPGSVLSPLSEGTNWLIKCGAAPITNYEDLSGLWPELAKLSTEKMNARAKVANDNDCDLPSVALEILARLDHQISKPFDLIVDESALPAGEVARLLGVLELEGRISRLPGANFLKNQTVDMG